MGEEGGEAEGLWLGGEFGILEFVEIFFEVSPLLGLGRFQSVSPAPRIFSLSPN